MLHTQFQTRKPVADLLRERITEALRNVDNSFQILALEGSTMGMQGTSEGNTQTVPSWDRYTGNVMILTNYILENMQDEAYKDHTKDKDPEKEPVLFHREVIALLERTGFFFSQVARSMAK